MEPIYVAAFLVVLFFWALPTGGSDDGPDIGAGTGL